MNAQIEGMSTEIDKGNERIKTLLQKWVRIQVLEAILRETFTSPNSRR